MQGVPLVVLANKQDLINALPAAEVTYSSVKGPPLHVQPYEHGMCTTECQLNSTCNMSQLTSRCLAFSCGVSHHPQTHAPCVNVRTHNLWLQRVQDMASGGPLH